MVEQIAKVPVIEFRAPPSHKEGLEVLDLDNFYKKLSQCSFDPAKPHRLKYYCFIYITEGEGRHFIDFKYHSFKQGSFIFISKNQVHAFDIASQAKGKMINVTEEFFDTILTNVRLPFFVPTYFLSSYTPVFDLSPALADTCGSLLYEIEKTQLRQSCDSLFSQLVFSSLLVALGEERKSSMEHLSEAQAVRFNHFLILITQKYTETRHAQDYAKILGVTYKSLNQLCKLACGKTAKQLIDTHIILEIKRRLAIGSSQVQEVAYQLGFDDVTYFMRFFKRHTQLTPSKFKACSYS
ncbi:AraC family transcriptional regulator [Shewanella sp. Isolate13]|uniref:AraC family transcriptional regulator n=1 Tax=Shewanella sp. Isolate13 TaxID=2908531 RepID=UPI001EFD28ED|nr:helix-turn-helix transcriptional regulator [Shewanella sp. Isolate13]MCG9729531.1 AraC family transcriptional regulator [Shewanella sp. Isolate13]